MADELVDGTSQEGAEAPAQDSGPVDNPDAGINPAWEPLRSKLDPVSFKLIEEDLRNWDKSAETRISTLNQSLSEYKKLGEPEQLQMAVQLAQRIDAEPEVIHQALGEFLQRTGRMPSQQELNKEVEEIEDEEESEENPQLREIRAQQEEIRNFLMSQEEKRLAEEADKELQSEVDALRQAHPELDDHDMQNIIVKAAFIAQQSKKVVSIEAVAKDYIENTRNRLLGAQRPGDSAPSLVPSSGGGVPMGGSQKSTGQLSRSETQDLVASLLEKNK